MFGIGGTELFIIAVFALLIFGPDKIPEIARTASQAIRMFKDAQADMQKVISGELNFDKPEDGEKKAYYAAGSSTAKQSAALDDSSAGTAAAPSAPAKPATTASEIWSDDDDEEGDEE